MKTLTRTMIVFVAVNLVMAGSVVAGNVAVEETSDAVETQAGQADALQKQAQLGQLLTDLELKPPEYASRISASRNVLLGSFPSSGAGAVLVIPSAEITAGEIATIAEDMNIMSRIFEKSLQQARIDVSSMFIPHTDPFSVAFARGRQTTQGMYLQGYGALFLMKVDFPLSPGPQEKEETETEKKNGDVDPVWTETKQQMYEPEGSRRQKKDRPAEKYDAEKVESLKTTLVKSLRHAANIRSLKPDESVILTVTGSGGSTSAKIIAVTRAGENQVLVQERDADGKTITRLIQGTGKELNEIGLSSPTLLVIRAKKSDIDRFAKGDLDLDQFQQNTQILTCAYLAAEGGGGDPHTFYRY